MDKVKVSIVRAYDYEITELIPAIESTLALIGGLDSIVKPGGWEIEEGRGDPGQ